MRKFLSFFIIIILCGCSSGEKVNCSIEGKDAIFYLKDGIIDKYEFDGKNQPAQLIDELNGTYFTSSTNNEEGKDVLRNYIESAGGTCE